MDVNSSNYSVTQRADALKAKHNQNKALNAPATQFSGLVQQSTQTLSADRFEAYKGRKKWCDAMC